MVTYISALNDCSGYANAARNYCAALIEAGVDFNIKPVSFERGKKQQHGSLTAKLTPFINKSLSTRINIIHLTPDAGAQFIEPNKYNIILSVWETTKLPPHWIQPLQNVQELWVPSQWCKEIYLANGLKPPIHVIPHCIDETTFTQGSSDKQIDVPNDTFLFYTIGQFLERKNHLGLLQAYLTEFGPEEKVCLLIKTYRQITGEHSQQDHDWIKNQIMRIKELLYLDKSPKLKLITEPLSCGEILAIHNRGNCFVLTSKAEGFSIGHMEAMLLGKPTIGTRYGGNLEFMNDGNSLLVESNETPVFGMPWSHYRGDGLWSEPHILSIRHQMRRAYTQKEEMVQLTQNAKQTIKENFSWQKIGQMMKTRLTEISKQLR